VLLLETGSDYAGTSNFYFEATGFIIGLLFNIIVLLLIIIILVIVIIVKLYNANDKSLIEKIGFKLCRIIIQVDSWLHATWVFLTFVIMVLIFMYLEHKWDLNVADVGYLEVFGLFIVYFIGDKEFEKDRNSSFIIFNTAIIFVFTIFTIFNFFAIKDYQKIIQYEIDFFVYLTISLIVFDMLRILLLNIARKKQKVRIKIIMNEHDAK
jgi:hypothetical protein